jgi:hypothetical protein
LFEHLPALAHCAHMRYRTRSSARLRPVFARRALKMGSVRGSLTALRARGTRTMKLCSFDARSEGRSGYPFPYTKSMELR